VAETGKELQSIADSSTRVTFSADGKRLATPKNDGSATIWDASDGTNYE
jgi:WD40 repeat protein